MKMSKKAAIGAMAVCLLAVGMGAASAQGMGGGYGAHYGAHHGGRYGAAARVEATANAGARNGAGYGRGAFAAGEEQTCPICGEDCLCRGGRRQENCTRRNENGREMGMRRAGQGRAHRQGFGGAACVRQGNANVCQRMQ